MPDMFPSTRWSCVLDLQNKDESIRFRALSELLEIYRPALLHYLVAVQRMPRDKAEDLVQSFVSDRIVQGSLLQKANASKGRLRSLLLRSFTNFIASEYRKNNAAKRSPEGGPLMALDQASEQARAVSFNQEELDEVWARQTIALAIQSFKNYCNENTRQDWLDVFEARILAPMLGEGTVSSYEELAKKYNFKKPQDAANVLVSAKRAFGRIIREIVAETVNDASQVNEEIMTMIEVFSRKSTGA